MTEFHNEELFRKQAIKSLSEKPPGRPICLVPKPWKWLSFLVALLFLSIVLFLGNAEYSRKESVRGWLVSKTGIVRVVNSEPAIIRKVVKQPGDHVKKGDPLIYLSTDTVLSDGTGKSEQVLMQLRREMAEVDKQLDLSREQQQLESTSLKQQLRDFDIEVSALTSRIVEKKRLIDLGNDKLRRLESAFAQGAVTRWDVLRQQEALSASDQELIQLKQDAGRQQRELELLNSRKDGLTIQSGIQRSTLRGRRAQLAQQIAEHESRRLSVLTSPVTGRVASVEVHGGYSISQQQLLMSILPENMDLAAEMYVPSRAAGFIKTGQNVHITYDAFPQQKFGTFDGRVIRISKFVLLPREIPQTFAVAEATYKIQVEIQDFAIETSVGVADLRPGMLLAAEIVLERRNLIDWLLEPLRLRRGTAR